MWFGGGGVVRMNKRERERKQREWQREWKTTRKKRRGIFLNTRVKTGEYSVCVSILYIQWVLHVLLTYVGVWVCVVLQGSVVIWWGMFARCTQRALIDCLPGSHVVCVGVCAHVFAADLICLWVYFDHWLYPRRPFLMCLSHKQI